ncbi:MAG: hypothetical protein JWL86_3974 [Rhizobium sp.]|nr:hypothetical protein [Rhizobium sp.]
MSGSNELPLLPLGRSGNKPNRHLSIHSCLARVSKKREACICR